jgi:hypothetical protein
MKPKTKVLNVSELLAERGRTHGRFRDHARVTQVMKHAIHIALVNSGVSLTDIQRESIDMILHKIGRIVSGNPRHRDHYDDIIGYTQLALNELDELEVSAGKGMNVLGTND